jgi:hypothetical protein
MVRLLTYVDPHPSVARPLWLSAGSVIRPIIPCGCRCRPTPAPNTVPTPTPVVPTSSPPNSSQISPVPNSSSPRSPARIGADATKICPMRISQARSGCSVGQSEAKTDKEGGSSTRNGDFTEHRLLLTFATAKTSSRAEDDSATSSASLLPVVKSGKAGARSAVHLDLERTPRSCIARSPHNPRQRNLFRVGPADEDRYGVKTHSVGTPHVARQQLDGQHRPRDRAARALYHIILASGTSASLGADCYSILQLKKRRQIFQ